MAFLQDNDKLIDDENQQDSNGQAQTQGSGGQNFVSGGGGADVGTGTANSAGVGAGGTGGWTNIQSFLGANKQDTGSADYVSQKIGSQFDQENQKLTESANSTKQQGQDQANRISQAAAGAKDTINDAAQYYDWGGNQNSQYTQKLKPLESALYDQYSGPSSFTYAFNDKTQKSKDALSNDQAMGSFLEDTYRERAGKPMTQGQLSLQRQFDTTNDPLAAARQQLLKQYAGLETTRDNTVKDTDSALKKAAEDFGNNQNQLKSTLANYGNEYDTSASQKEADARKAYQNSYQNEGLGQKNLYWDRYNSVLANDEGNSPQVRAAINAFQNRNLWSDNMTADQLSRQNQYVADLRAKGTQLNFGNDEANANSALQSFFDIQDKKYATTAQPEKAAYNLIQELLRTGNKKDQNFNVRG